MSKFTFGKASHLSDELHQVRADELAIGNKLIWNTPYGYTCTGEVVNVRTKGSHVVAVVHTRDRVRRGQMSFEKFSFIRDTIVTLHPNATITPSESVEVPISVTYSRNSRTLHD